jgi:hypothetical protein
MSIIKYFAAWNIAPDDDRHIKLLVLLLFLLLLPQIPFLLSATTATFGDNYEVFAQSEDAKNNTNMSPMKDNIISSSTEWEGIFALGMTVGLVSPLRYKSVYSKSRSIRITDISIAILSISAGIIHLLLIQEHMKESFMWGISFLISGIAQIIFGIILIILREKLSPIKSILYYFGIVGNALLVGIFVFVRLFTPPFSTEGAPINELEPNGIITIITELVLIVLLAYLIKSSSVKIQRNQKMIH